jgi:hypothetical protein
MKLSKLNFNYKNNNMNPKKFLILKYLETQQKILMNDNKSIQNSLRKGIERLVDEIEN